MNSFQKQHLIIILLSLAVLGLVVFVIHPSAGRIMDRQEELIALADQIEANSEASSGSLQSINEFNEQKDKVEDIYNTAVMTDDNQLEFVRFLENLEREEIRTQITFNPTEQMLFNKNPVTPFTIKTMSSLPEFTTYLSDIESSEYYILIHEVELKPLYTSSNPAITARGTIEGFVFLD